MHDSVAKCSHIYYKSCLFFLFRGYRNLVISRIGIQRAKVFEFGRCIHQLINFRKGEKNFGACLVQVSEVYTYFLFLIHLLHQYNIRYHMGNCISLIKLAIFSLSTSLTMAFCLSRASSYSLPLYWY